MTCQSHVAVVNVVRSLNIFIGGLRVTRFEFAFDNKTIFQSKQANYWQGGVAKKFLTTFSYYRQRSAVNRCSHISNWRGTLTLKDISDAFRSLFVNFAEVAKYCLIHLFI